MKKSLVLAMAMALGVTASAYAANPFSDVPAGHWAYDSIDKLAAAGVIDGMGDGTYQGDKTMTRYEMAQIVAKAMAKGANVDKLAAEFADELDNLGVRVANLEKKADNVKISGMTRFNYWGYHANADSNAVHVNGSKNHAARQRTDITLTGTINEDWTYTALLRNQQYFNGSSAGKGEETVNFQRAYVNGRIGGVKVQAGRYNDTIEDGLIYDHRVDGIMASYGKDVKVTVGYGQQNGGGHAVTSADLNDDKDAWVSSTSGCKADSLMYARLDAKVGKIANAHVGYYKFRDLPKVSNAIGTEAAPKDLTKFDPTQSPEDLGILAVGINAKVAKNLNLSATLLKSDADDVMVAKKGVTSKKELDDLGYVIGLDYKGANRNKVGSYGISAKYYNQPTSTFVAHTMDGAFPSDADTDGFKGFMVGGRYTIAKNVTLGLDYYGLKARNTNAHYDTVYSLLQFNF